MLHSRNFVEKQDAVNTYIQPYFYGIILYIKNYLNQYIQGVCYKTLNMFQFLCLKLKFKVFGGKNKTFAVCPTSVSASIHAVITKCIS